MSLSGTLKDFGISDIFQLISHQQKTGILHLRQHEKEVQVAFKDGNVVHAKSMFRKRKEELLGEMLVRAGLVTEKQVEEALAKQKLNLRRLGDILVQSCAISRELLKEMGLLQTSETLYPLFAWKSGTYEFEGCEVEFDPGFMTALRAESVLMEGFRRVDEWPAIRKKITDYSCTFERLKALPPKSKAADDFDTAFADAFDSDPSAAPEKDQSSGQAENLESKERVVYALAEPGRDVRSIIDRSRMGEFEACKALYNLINAGYVRLGERREGSSPGRRACIVRRRMGYPKLVLGQAATMLFLVALLVVMAIQAQKLYRPTAQADLPASDPALKRAIGRAQISRIHAAISMFALQNGRLPQSLPELTSTGILADQELRYPWREAYFYRKTSPTAYILLPPLR